MNYFKLHHRIPMTYEIMLKSGEFGVKDGEFAKGRNLFNPSSTAKAIDRKSVV